MRRIWVLAGVALLLGLSTGCVSLAEYNAKKDRVQQQKRVIGTQDAEIVGLQNMVDILEARLKKALAEATLLREKAAWYSEAANRRSTEPDPAYLESLRALREQEPEIVINEDTGGIVLESDIFFASGKADLSPAGKGALDRILDLIQAPEYGGYDIEIAGHTDTDPIRKAKFADNWQLSTERARTVLGHLVKRGIAEERLHISGWAYTQPRRPNTNRDNKRMNRRVEILLFQPRTTYTEGR